MATIINLSNVIDNSGDTPIVTYSNPVTTLVISPTQPPFVPRMSICPYCDSCQNFCGCVCNCGCQCNRNCNCNNCCNN